MQMVGLYRDPTGEKVFEKYDKPSSRSQVPVVSGTGDNTDSLKKRVRELEGILMNHVCYIETPIVSYS